MPKDDPNGNRHGGQGTQIWFDPVADAQTADWEEMVWRAESYARNGEPKNWVITRIVGENGTSGENAIYLDLDNENDALLYRGDGTRIPIDVTSTAIIKVPRGCCFSLSVDAVPATTDPTVTPAPVINVQNANFTVSRIA